MVNISTDDLFKEYNIIEFEKVIELELNTNYYKIINNELKCDIDISYKNSIHEHSTRHAKDMHKIKTKNIFGKLSFINRGISIYNNLSSPLKRSKNTNIFKKNVKKLLLDRQLVQSMQLTIKKPKKKRYI